MACHVVDDSVETYLGSAALFEFTFLDSPETRAGGYPERWGMTSLLGVDFGGAAVLRTFPDDEGLDDKTKFDDDDDDDFDDDDDEEDDFDDEDDDDDDDDDEDDEDFDEEF